MKFERKAPTLEGCQWDGTVDGAGNLATYIDEHWSERGIYFTHQVEYGPAPAYGRLLFQAHMARAIGRETMRAGEWLVQHDDGSMQILEDYEIQHAYKPVVS